MDFDKFHQPTTAIWSPPYNNELKSTGNKSNKALSNNL